MWNSGILKEHSMCEEAKSIDLTARQQICTIIRQVTNYAYKFQQFVFSFLYESRDSYIIIPDYFL